MAFTLPDDLPPELYPLAWLVGTWRGYGILTYGETVPEQPGRVDGTDHLPVHTDGRPGHPLEDGSHQRRQP